MKRYLLLFGILTAMTLAGCGKPSQNKKAEPKASPGTSAPGAPAESPSQPSPIQPGSTPAGEAENAAPIQIPNPVATVDGTPISSEEFESSMKEVFGSMGLQPNMLPASQRLTIYRQFLDDLIMEKLLEKAAQSVQVSKAEVDEELDKVMAQFGGQENFTQQLQNTGQTLDQFRDRLTKVIRQRKWLEEKVVPKDKISEAEAKKFYDGNPQDFEQPELVRASHILIMVDPDATPAQVEAKKQEALKALDRVKKGEDFSKVAKEVSEDPTAKENGGDLNYFSKDRMVPEFSEVAFSEKVGEVSEPVRTDFGWHIIKVTDKKEPRKVPFEEVKSDIENYLLQMKEQKSMEEVLNSLRSKADVKVFLPEPPASSSTSESNEMAAPASSQSSEKAAN